MKRQFLSAVTVATLILVIPSFLLSCDKNQNPASSNSEKSENSAVISGLSSSLSLSPSVKSSPSSSTDSSKSIFDIMKEENLDVVSIDDSNPERAKLLREFLENVSLNIKIYYSESFINSIDDKELYNVEFCHITKSENDNYYTWGRVIEDTDSLCNVLMFNAIKTTGQENEYIIFDTELPKQNVFENYKCTEDITGVHIVIKNNKIEKFKTPVGDFVFWDTSMNDYINQKQLVGNYQDQDGKMYQFTKEKVSIWGDHSFQYLLYDINVFESWGFWFDCNALCEIDPVTKKTTGTFYGYKFVKDEMYIYKMIEGHPWGYYPEDNPILILHKVE